MHQINIALGVNSVILKEIVYNYLSQQYKFYGKEIDIDIFYDGSKLFTKVPGICRVIFALTQFNNT